MPGFQKGSRRGALITNCSTFDQLEFDRLVFRSIKNSISRKFDQFLSDDNKKHVCSNFNSSDSRGHFFIC